MSLTQHHTLLRLLSDGRFHSGQDLAASMDISRTAVWKRLQHSIAELGLEIEARRGKGYRLAQPLELLDASRIREIQTGEGLLTPPRLDIHLVTDSTNRQLLDDALRGAPSGACCLAEYQTAGRGRRGRQWVSPFGSNLYLSLLHRSSRGPGGLGGLSLAAGLTLARLLRRAGASEVGLKWPNDLLWRGRKLAGLLVEVIGEQGGPSRVVIGLGLNLRLPQNAAQGIDQPWVDLQQILGPAMPSRNQVAAQLCSALLEMLRDFDARGLPPWLDLWPQYDLYLHQPVELIMGERREYGICRGIDENGALLLEQAGQITPWHGGEVSLRGRS